LGVDLALVLVGHELLTTGGLERVPIDCDALLVVADDLHRDRHARLDPTDPLAAVPVPRDQPAAGELVRRTAVADPDLEHEDMARVAPRELSRLVRALAHVAAGFDDERAPVETLGEYVVAVPVLALRALRAADQWRGS